MADAVRFLDGMPSVLIGMASSSGLISTGTIFIDEFPEQITIPDDVQRSNIADKRSVGRLIFNTLMGTCEPNASERTMALTAKTKK